MAVEHLSFSLLGVLSFDGYSTAMVEWAMGRFGGRYGDHSTPFIFGQYDQKKILEVFRSIWNLYQYGGNGVLHIHRELDFDYTLKSLKGDFLGMDLDGLDSFFNSYVDLGSGINFPVWALLAFLITLSI